MPYYVCPMCGPERIAYAGRVVSVICPSCREELVKMKAERLA